MTAKPLVVNTSEFLLRELQAVGDAISGMLQHGIEELGAKILSRVQPLIDQKHVTHADVVQLVLVCDALLVAEEAMLADSNVSDPEVEYAHALVSEAARRLGPFRAFYHQSSELDADGVRVLVKAHRADKQPFGGACEKTRWLGLAIVRRLADKTGDRGALDQYAELMVRLIEEIVALEQARMPAEQARKNVEQKLGLRKLLEDAQQKAPAPKLDPRIRAFCAPDGLDIFHAVEHANQISIQDPFDVDTVHAAPRATFSRLLRRAAGEREAGTGRVLVVLGDSGSGKTHLMRVFRNQVHGERLGYVGYLQLSGSHPDYGRYVLGSLIDSLERPYYAPEVQESGLMCLSDALLTGVQSIGSEVRTALRESELANDELSTFVHHLADDVVRDPRFRSLDIDLIRALLFLQRRDPPFHARVIKFLRGQPLGRHDLALLGDLAPRSDDALGLLGAIAKLIAAVNGGALVLLLDQLEDVYNQPNAKEQYVRLMDVVRHVSDSTPNGLIVVSCLTDLYTKLREMLGRAVLDRIERDPEPQRLNASRSLEEIAALVERRLAELYDTQGVRHRAADPHFPIPRTLLERQAELRLRDVLDNLQDYRLACIAAGGLVEIELEQLVTESAKPSRRPPPPDTDALHRAWADWPKDSVEVPTEDEAVRELLVWCLASAVEGVSVDNKNETLLVRTAQGAQLSVALTNDTSRSGLLARRIDAVVKDAKKQQRVPVVVRCSEFGGRPGTDLAKQLGVLAKVGGRRITVEQSTWQQALAFRSFSEKHTADPGWKSWTQTEAPLLKLDALRDVLGIPPGAAVPTIPPVEAVGKKSSSRPPGATGVEQIEPVSPVIIEHPGNDVKPFVLQLGVTISVRQQPANIPMEQLKRHCAFLGASGSGKTSLALNVIEQAAERGIGAILLDRKGDLCTYADPECWHRRDADPKRLKRKRELRERLDVRVYTPGKQGGRSLRIRAVPNGLAELPKQDRSHLARFAAQGLGAMMGFKGSGADLTYLGILGKAIEVIGEISAQKDIGLREVIDLIADEDESFLAELGHLDPKHCKKLIQHLETLWLNHSELLVAEDPPLSADILLGRDGSVPRGKVPMSIISTKFLGGPQRVDFWVSQLLVELSRWSSRSPSAELQALLFIDEADIYLPATSKPATKEPLQDLLKRARSAGLGVMLATQSPGDLDYKARDTILTWWLGRISSRTAIDKMKPLLSECRTDFSGSLASAGVGEFYQVSDGNSVRMRSDRSLMDTVQLTEDRILDLARSGAPRADRVA